MALGNLAQRALVAVVAVPVVLLVVYADRPEPTWALVFVASLLAMREFFAMTMPDAAEAGQRQAALVLGALAIAPLYWLHPIALHSHSPKVAALALAGPVLVMVLAVLGPMLYFLFRFGDVPGSARRMTATITGIVYAGVLATFLTLLKRDFGPAGGDLVIVALLIGWIGDTAAYFAGRFLGKHKLYEAVSPKKTWEGAIGGLVGSVVAVGVMKLLRLEHLGWVDVVLLGAVGGMLGQMGDLAESLLKRSVGVKDSGALLPGHGGMLDRIDAVLFIAPYVYLYLWLKPALA